MDVLIVAAMFSEGILDNNDIYTIQATKQHDHILKIQLSWRDVPVKTASKSQEPKITYFLGAFRSCADCIKDMFTAVNFRNVHVCM